MNRVTFGSSKVEFNHFDMLPNEIILKNIGHYLTPKEALSVRCVNRRFAVLFGDSFIWRIYYRALGLEPVPSSTSSGFQLSNLAKTLPFWTYLQKVIDSKVKNASQNFYNLEFPRSLCIAVLTISELYPLHSYVIKLLEKHCSIPAGLSADELILRVAREDEGFNVNNGARILAQKTLSKRASEPVVQQALVSVITNIRTYGPYRTEICSKVVKGLLPYLNHPQILSVILDCLQKYGPFTVKPALDTLITNPRLFDAVINSFAKGYGGLDNIVRKHLNNASVVEKLVQRLSRENNVHLVYLLAWALKPVSDQKSVQQALCQRMVEIRPGENWHAENALYHVVSNARLVRDIKEEYRDRIPVLQERDSADVILQFTVNDIVEKRQQLFAALSSQNIFERAAAATLLAPLVPNDPEVLAAFLDRIYAGEHGKVGIIIVSALAQLAYRKEIRDVLIHKGPLDGKINPNLYCDDSAQRLVTVQALRTFVSEPEVRKAFLNMLSFDDSEEIRCTLIDIFTPQLDKWDVRTLFLEAAKGELWQQYRSSGMKWQIAAIDKLGSVINIPEVKAVLLQLYEKKSYGVVNAACIRVLCADKQKYLIGIDKIFVDCIDRSREVCKEARRALVRKLNERL